MSRPPLAVIAALFAMTLLPSQGGAQNDQMHAPAVAWTESGAKPFVERDGANHPTVIGLMIPAATVKALPAKRSEAVYPLDGAGLVRSANLQWHPMGHEPEHVYDVPHFDVHFYTISEDVRHSIVPDAPAGSIRPTSEMLPPGAILAPGYEPMMGMHAIPHTQPEFNGGKFAVSPIVGYWNNDVAFFEIMFTKAWLDAHPDVDADFPQPASVRQQHGWYPTRYAVHYDKAKDAYTIQITNFRNR